MPSISLSAAIDLFLDARIAEGKSDATLKTYRASLRTLRHYTGEILLAAVDETVLRGYLKDARLRDRKQDTNPYRPTVYEPLSRETIRTYYRHIRVFIGWCVEEGYLDRNPSDRVKMPPPEKHAPKGLSDDDFQRLLAATGEASSMPERDRALVLLMADTGARARGIVGLTLEQLDLENGLIEVIEKGDKSRLVPVSEVTIEALLDWLTIRQASTGERHVFVSYTGRPLTTSGLYQVLKRLAERAGVEGRYNPHAFRHFFGRKWMESGGDISPLSDVLGHSQIHVTKQYYLRFDIETVRRQHRLHSPVAGLAD